MALKHIAQGITAGLQPYIQQQFQQRGQERQAASQEQAAEKQMQRELQMLEKRSQMEFDMQQKQDQINFKRKLQLIRDHIPAMYQGRAEVQALGLDPGGLGMMTDEERMLLQQKLAQIKASISADKAREASYGQDQSYRDDAMKVDILKLLGPQFGERAEGYETIPVEEFDTISGNMVTTNKVVPRYRDVPAQPGYTEILQDLANKHGIKLPKVSEVTAAEKKGNEDWPDELKNRWLSIRRKAHQGDLEAMKRLDNLAYAARNDEDYYALLTWLSAQPETSITPEQAKAEMEKIAGKELRFTGK